MSNTKKELHKDISKDAILKSSDNTLIQKRKILEEVFSRIDKQYGKGSIMVLDEKRNIASEVSSIGTGSLLLDKAIGIGGIPRGRIIEIFGPEASGKTTISLQIIAEAQKANGVAAFIDAEHALDIAYAKNLNIKTEELILSQPDYGEQALDIVEMLVRSNAVDVIVVDSVAALVPKHELEGDMGDSHIGLQARLMSQALRKLTALVHRSNTSLIFINQVRQNINALAFGPKETTTGGNALKFYSSVRLDVRRIESLKDRDGSHYGNKLSIKVVKNKMAIPFKNVIVQLIFGQGINRYAEVIDICLSQGVIEQSGSWFSMGNEKLCQGRDSLTELMKKDKNLFEMLLEKINPVVPIGIQEEDIINAKRESND